MRAASRESLTPWVRLGVVLVFVLVGMVWQRVQARSLDREAKAIRLEVDRLRFQNGNLQSQIHQWTAPSRLEALAKEKYGLVPLTPTQRVTVPAS